MHRHSIFNSKSNVDDGAFDGNDKLINDDNVDESVPIINFEDEGSEIGSSKCETLKMLH